MKKLTVILLALIVFCNILSVSLLYQSLTHPYRYSNEIKRYSLKYNLDPKLVASLINVESHYNKDAVSNKGAIGLGQMLPSTASYMANFYHEKSEIDLKNPDTNIKFTCMYLSYLSKKFDSTRAVLASYNAGETNVRTWQTLDPNLDKIPYVETKNYIKKVYDNMQFYSKVY